MPRKCAHEGCEREASKFSNFCSDHVPEAEDISTHGYHSYNKVDREYNRGQEDGKSHERPQWNIFTDDKGFSEKYKKEYEEGQRGRSSSSKGSRDKSGNK